ncbi:sigma-70 family RNA polymerase sigma factor [Nocardia sp. NPDC051756]|uniref:RNA polymerase sigma factor n=1 Tax=Nocardia sp. NPDC051756 TaxID=3154751 RepID=UPI00342D5661
MVEPENTEAELRPFRAPMSLIDGVDLAAFSDFYRSFSPRLFAFLIYQGARSADAAEIVQDTMTKAWQSWSTIRYVEAWTRRVASRALVRRIASLEEDSVAAVPEQSALLATHAEMDAWEQKHDLLRVLALLPPRQRQIMAWTLEGFTPGEISAELLLSADAVRSNLKKARRSIARHLGSMNEGS